MLVHVERAQVVAEQHAEPTVTPAAEPELEFLEGGRRGGPVLPPDARMLARRAALSAALARTHARLDPAVQRHDSEVL